MANTLSFNVIPFDAAGNLKILLPDNRQNRNVLLKLTTSWQVKQIFSQVLNVKFCKQNVHPPCTGGLACRSTFTFFFFLLSNFLGEESLSVFCLFAGLESLKCDGTCLASPSLDEKVSEQPLIMHLNGLAPVWMLTCLVSQECERLGLSNTLQPSHRHTKTSWLAIGSTCAVLTCSDSSVVFWNVKWHEIHLHSTVVRSLVVTALVQALLFLWNIKVFYYCGQQMRMNQQWIKRHSIWYINNIFVRSLKYWRALHSKKSKYYTHSI